MLHSNRLLQNLINKEVALRKVLWLHVISTSVPSKFITNKAKYRKPSWVLTNGLRKCGIYTQWSFTQP
jgi:hypothetical protein